MTEEGANRAEAPAEAPRDDVGGKLDGAAWGLFFVWVGIVLLVDVPEGAALLGVGIIILGAQAFRRRFQLPLEGFWMVVGLLFAVGGLWQVLAVQLPFFPMLIICAGALLVAGAIWGKGPMKKGGSCCWPSHKHRH